MTPLILILTPLKFLMLFLLVLQIFILRNLILLQISFGLKILVEQQVQMAEMHMLSILMQPETLSLPEHSQEQLILTLVQALLILHL